MTRQAALALRLSGIKNIKYIYMHIIYIYYSILYLYVYYIYILNSHGGANK